MEKLHKDLRELIGQGKKGKVYSTDKKILLLKLFQKINLIIENIYIQKK